MTATVQPVSVTWIQLMGVLHDAEQAAARRRDDPLYEESAEDWEDLRGALRAARVLLNRAANG